jgi:hypothetical protein
MKIRGKEVKGVSEEVLVLPRLDGNIVFKAKAVTDMELFQKMCPLPKAPSMLVAGGFQSNTADPNYLKMIQRHSELRMGYIMIKSLEPSEIEWDTVVLDQPQSWLNWREDLSKAGFTEVEIERITVCVLQANCLDESKLARAREDFLAGQGMLAKFSGLPTEPANTPSGEPVNDSE